jgi:hypothetical protein
VNRSGAVFHDLVRHLEDPAGYRAVGGGVLPDILDGEGVLNRRDRADEVIQILLVHVVGVAERERLRAGDVELRDARGGCRSDDLGIQAMGVVSFSVSFFAMSSPSLISMFPEIVVDFVFGFLLI